jgi:hypothetical protein
MKKDETWQDHAKKNEKKNVIMRKIIAHADIPRKCETDTGHPLGKKAY